MDLREAYRLEQKILNDQLAVVRSTIVHRGEKGRALESYVSQLLHSVLPREYGITTGFIAFPPDEIGGEPTLSDQLDIIICDALHGSPLLRLPTCDVLPLEAVFGYVEVKTKLKGTKGDSSIFHCLQQAQKVRRHTTRYFWVSTGRNSATPLRFSATSTRSYVFAFEGRGEIETLVRTASETLGESADFSGMFINDKGFFRSRPNARPEVDTIDKENALAAFKNAIVHDLARFDRYPGSVIKHKGRNVAVMTAYLDHYLPERIQTALSLKQG